MSMSVKAMREESFRRIFFNASTAEMENQSSDLCRRTSQVFQQLIRLVSSISDLRPYIQEAIERDSPGRIKVLMAHPTFSDCMQSMRDHPLVVAAEEGKVRVIKTLFGAPRQLREIPPQILGEMLVKASGRGDLETVQTVLDCGRLQEIPQESLGEALRVASELEEPKIVRRLLQCNGIPQEVLGEVFLRINSQGLRHFEMIQAFLDFDTFGQIPVEALEEGLSSASRRGDVGVIEIVLNSPRFEAMPEEEVARVVETALMAAVEENLFTVVERLLKHHKTEKISAKAVLKILIYASERGWIFVVRVLLKKAAFQEITARDFGRGVVGAICYCQTEMIQELLRCDMFRWMPTDVLSSVLWWAGHSGCLIVAQALPSCEHFEEISPEALGNALLEASKNGNQLCVQTLLSWDKACQIPREMIGRAIAKAYHFEHLGIRQLLLKFTQRGAEEVDGLLLESDGAIDPL